MEKGITHEKTLEITIGIVKKYHLLEKYLTFRQHYYSEAVLRSNSLGLTWNKFEKHVSLLCDSVIYNCASDEGF